MHLTIITGASRGLGHAMAQQRLNEGHLVVAISRQNTVLAAAPRGQLESWQADLSDSAAVAARLGAWLLTQAPTQAASATLINNAAMLQTPAPLSDLSSPELAAISRVGLEAPMMLTAAFLRATQTWPCLRKVVLVSSGLGRRGMAGASSYCAIKAGLDNLARAVALEEADKPNGARISSVAPGIIDTDMQVQLRTANAQQFPEGARFAALHQAGQLDSPERAAANLLAYLDRANFGSNPVGDVRDA